MVSEAVLEGVGLAIYVIIAFVFCLSSLLLAKIVSPSRPNPRKTMTYECGQIPDKRGQQFIIKGVWSYVYYLFIFLIVDASACVILTFVFSPLTATTLFVFLFFLSLIFVTVGYFLKSFGVLR